MTTGFFLKKKSYNWSFLILDFRVGYFHISQKRLPTPVFWPGEFHGLCSPWGPKELDTTKQAHACMHSFLRLLGRKVSGPRFKGTSYAWLQVVLETFAGVTWPIW